MTENSSQKNKLTPRQNKALAVLVAGGTWQDAAAAAGVSETSVHRWGRQDAFSEELQRLSRLCVQDATRRLSGQLDAAVGVMADIMLDEQQRASVRLRAANYVAMHALKLIETTDIMQRLDELEQRLQLAR